MKIASDFTQKIGRTILINYPTDKSFITGY